jgi:hypothetical protein
VPIDSDPRFGGIRKSTTPSLGQNIPQPAVPVSSAGQAEPDNSLRVNQAQLAALTPAHETLRSSRAGPESGPARRAAAAYTPVSESSAVVASW